MICTMMSKMISHAILSRAPRQLYLPCQEFFAHEHYQGNTEMFDRAINTEELQHFKEHLRGDLHEVFWEVERWQAPPELQSTLHDRPQKYTGRGAAVRCLHHVTLNASQIRACREFYQQHLGFRYHDGAILDGTDQELTAFLAVTAHHHDLGLIRDPAGARGRLNHIAFYLDTREEVMRAADVLRDYDKTIIEFGPGRHAGDEAFFLYLREPGGNRIELYTGEALILAPDWEPVRWLASENPMLYWGGAVPRSMYEYATPLVDRPKSA